jgi:hypothetical protein
MKKALRLISCAVLLATILLATSIQPAAAEVVVRTGTVFEGQATLDYTITISTSYSKSIITVGGAVTAGWWAFGGAKGYIHVYNYANWNVSGQLFYNVLSGQGHASQTVARGNTSPYFYTSVKVPNPANSCYLGSGTIFIKIIVDSTYFLYPGIGQTVWVGAYTPGIIDIRETSLSSAQTMLNAILAALGVFWPLPSPFPP